MLSERRDERAHEAAAGSVLAPRRRWVAALGVLFVAVSALYGASPADYTRSDPFLSVPTAVSLVKERNLDIDEYVTGARQRPEIASFFRPLLHEHDGHFYNFFPWVASLAAVPGVVALEAAERVGMGTGAEFERFEGIQRTTAAAVGGAIAVVLAVMAATVLGTRRRGLALGVAAAAAVATPLWTNAGVAMWLHGPSVLTLALALVMAARIRARGGTMDQSSLRRHAAAMGALVAVAYMVRPTNALVVLALGTWLLARQRPALAWYVGGGLVAAVPFFVVNALEFGQVLPWYYVQREGFTLHDDYVSALFANLVSPARGLFVFAPVLALGLVGPVVRARRGEPVLLEVLLAGAFAAHVVLVAGWFWWWAGHSWGPRFMTETVVLLVFLALPAVGALATGVWDARRRAGAAAVGIAVAWGAFAQGQGALVTTSNCWNTTPQNIDVSASERVWSWTRPQVLAGVQCRTTKRGRSGRLA